jgi:hypothetical protein
MPKRVISILAVVAALAVALLAVATAQGAATLYAAPTAQGTGDCSSAVNACPLSTAVTTAVSGDTIEVLAGMGPYTITSTISDSPGVALSFVGSGGQPHLVGDLPSTSIVTLSAAGSSLENLSIANSDTSSATSTAISLSGGVTADRVIATSVAQACEFDGGVAFTNSVCTSTGTSGEGGVAVLDTTGSNTLRNDTIWGEGEGAGIQGIARLGSGPGDDTLVNTIISADNGTGLGSDLYAYSDGSTGATMTFNATYSNFLSANPSPAPTGTPSMEAINTDATDQTSTPPQLASPSNGDFHEQPGSPTIGAGQNDFNDDSDLYGNSRQTTTSYYFSYGQSPAVGTRTTSQSLTTTDIGAAQSQSLPLAAATGATSVGEDSATLGGQIYPDGAIIAHPVSAPLSGLTPGATYYFELVANDPSGPSTSEQLTFTPGGSNTTITPNGTTPNPNPSITPTLPGPLTTLSASISITATTGKVVARKLAIPVHCTASVNCTGSLHLIAIVMSKVRLNGKAKTERKVVAVASGTYAVAAAATGTATLKLTASSVALVASHKGKLAGLLEITPAGAENTVEQHFTVTTKAKKKAKAKPKPKPKKKK